MKPDSSIIHYHIHYNVNITEIVKDEKHWIYTVEVINNKLDNHTTKYISTNKVSLTKHREQMIARYKKEHESAYAGSFVKTEQVRETVSDFFNSTEQDRS